MCRVCAVVNSFSRTNSEVCISRPRERLYGGIGLIMGIFLLSAEATMKSSESVWIYIGTETSYSSRGIYRSRLDLGTGELDQPVLAAELSSPAFLTTDPSKQFLYCTGKPGNGDLPYNTVSGFMIDHASGALTKINSQTIENMACCHISCSLGGSVLLGADYGHGMAASFPLDSDGSIAEPETVLKYDSPSMVVPSRQNAPFVHSINMDVSGSYVFVCDFSGDKIHIYKIDPETKKLRAANVVTVAPGAGPRHLVCHPDGKLVYVINELNATISVFDFDTSTGALELLQTVTTLPKKFKGENTTAEIALSPDLRFLYGSNRGHDSIAYYRVNSETGELSPQGSVSTEGEHPRNFTIDPTGKFMLVSNRDSDNVTVFRLDPETGKPIYTGNQIKLSMPMRIEFVQ